MMDGWHDSGWGPGTWIGMGLLMLAFWSLIAVLVVYTVRNLGTRHATPNTNVGAPRDARRILDERLARGDIDADEYNQRRALLRSR